MSFRAGLKGKVEDERRRESPVPEQQTLCSSQVNDFTTALEEMEQLLEI